MRNLNYLLLVLALIIQACNSSQKFLGVHEIGPGKITAESVAEAHQRDLEVQGKHNVNFLKYWVSADKGVVYCLSESEDSTAISNAHQEAHGLIAGHVYEVTEGEEEERTGGKKLFIDIHKVGPGNVNAQAIEQAHKKDLAIEHKRGVNFIQYWVDEKKGAVICLSEALDSASVYGTHQEAHGMTPESVVQVTEGE